MTQGTKKRAGQKSIVRVFVIAALFWAVTMPFRRLFALNGMTEVRPAGAFPPVFGLLYGLPGALGCAVGNLAADIQSGYPASICAWGFLAQFLYGYAPHVVWRQWNRSERSIRLSNVRFVLRYIAITVADSLLIALCLGMILQRLGLGVLLSTGTLLLAFNNITFCLVLGIPIIIAINVYRRNYPLTLNIQFVLMFLLLSVLSALILGVVSYNEIMAFDLDLVHRWNRIYVQVTLNFFLLWTVSTIFLWYLERRIARPMSKLSHIAREYADDETIDEHPGQRIQNDRWLSECETLGELPGEIGSLALAFRKMMRDVMRYITELTAATKERERIDTELDVAAHIQNGILPDSHTVFSDVNQFCVCAKMYPAKHVAGDFYDFFLVDDDHIAFLVADVSGKGVPASLFMMVAKTLIHNEVCNGKSPAQAFTEVNEELCQNNPNDMFVTAWLGILTLSTGQLEYANAGHNAPLFSHNGADYVFAMERTGFVLAGLENMVYTQQEITLTPNDTIFLYTDGVTEANNPEHNLYGEDRLRSLCNCNRDGTVEEILDAVWSDIEEYRDTTEQFDDVTMLAIRYHGSGYTTCSVEPDICNMPELTQHARFFMEKHGISRPTIDTIEIAIDELFSNVCYYSGARHATLGVRILSNTDMASIQMYLEDDGIPYNPLEQQNPDVHKPLRERGEGGLGIYIIKTMADSITYRYDNNKNYLWLSIKNNE